MLPSFCDPAVLAVKRERDSEREGNAGEEETKRLFFCIQTNTHMKMNSENSVGSA